MAMVTEACPSISLTTSADTPCSSVTTASAISPHRAQARSLRQPRRRRHLRHRPNRPSCFRASHAAHHTVRCASLAYPGAHGLPLGRGRRQAHAPYGLDTVANRAVEMYGSSAIPSSLVSPLYFLQSIKRSTHWRDAGGLYLGAATVREKQHG